MNINKLFKFKRYPSRTESFDVIHRDSDHTVMDVIQLGRPGCPWQAHRNGKIFEAATRAAAVRGLVNRDLGLLAGVLAMLREEG